MKKNKPFVYIAILVILFIMGNLATSVRATSTSVVTTTPMPTVTPIGTPVIPPGGIPSLEEQEKIKSVIQTYFDMRYRALSVSDSEDYKRNGFGNLISDTHEAGIFLRKEMGKLAVEVEYAEMNRLRYLDYTYFLDFRSIVVDQATQTATISLSEENEVVYEISAERNPEKPIVSHQYNIVHTIVLHKKQGKWHIVSDEYIDNIWRMLRQAGKSTNEILRATDEMLRNMKASPRMHSADTSAAFVNAIPADSSTHSYDRAGAVEYALEHAKSYNPNYPNYNSGDDALPWGDCTNFVSQAIYEGEMRLCLLTLPT
jgi:hypothetical protein